MAGKKIVWDFWFAMPSVYVWQAVALSLNIEPDQLKAHQDGPSARDSTVWKDPALFRNSSTCDEFDKRCRLLGSSVGNRDYFTPGILSLEHNSRHGVRLTEVAQWLKALGRAPVAAEMLSRTDVKVGARSTTPAAPQSGEAVPQKLHIWQEDQIRRTTLSLGLIPLALPPDDPKANSYAKAKIRDRCEKNHKEKMRKNIFDKAWQRMMSSGSLRYAE